MPRVRDPDLPQHHMDQGHYGEMDLDLLPSGTTQGDVILWDDGLNTWYIDQPPGGGSGGSGTIDLLVGDDQTFNGSMGNWTNSGGTRELGFGMLAERPQGTDYSASMKFTTTANSQYVDILVSGTFLEGHFYSSAILINSPDATPPTVQAILGLIGTDSSTETYASLVSGSDPNEDWGVIYVSWVPTADRIGVSLRINRSAGTGTKIFNIGYVRVVNGPIPFIEGRNGDTLVPANFSLATRYGLEGVQMNMNDEAGSEWSLDVYRDGVSAGLDVSVWPQGGWSVWAQETSGDRRFTGLLMVGNDYLGVSLGEFNATTLQMFPVDDHDIILLDGDSDESTRHWIARNQSGTQSVNLSSALSNPDVVPTSKGWVFPSLASDPTGPMEGQKYYNTTDDVYRSYINGGWVTDAATGTDVLVKGSANDTTANYLIPKISGSGTVALYEHNDGGNEVIVISGTSVLGGLNFMIGDGVSVIATGQKGQVRWPFGGTVQRASLMSVISGSIVVDIWKDSWANYPPNSGDSITASAKPTLSSARNSEDTTLSGWTTAFSEGDVYVFNVDSASTLTQVTLELKYQRA